jgi:hypothetical protein
MASFILNEGVARDWVTSLVVAYELADLDASMSIPQTESALQFGMDWRPREPGQEDVVSALICQAQRQPGVLARPENAQVAVEFVDDGDDWCYHFLLHINAPVSVTLASVPKEVSRLGDDFAFGVDAAVEILREAVQTADELLERLNAFVKATIREA